MPKAIKERVEKYCKKVGITLSQFYRLAILEFLIKKENELIDKDKS